MDTHTIGLEPAVEDAAPALVPFKVRDVGFRLGIDFTSTTKLLELLEGPENQGATGVQDTE